MATVVQLLQVEFDPTDTFYPLNLSRVQEIESDIYGHVFKLDQDCPDFETLERAIEEEIVSETGLMVRQFDYQLVDTLVWLFIIHPIAFLIMFRSSFQDFSTQLAIITAISSTLASFLPRTLANDGRQRHAMHLHNVMGYRKDQPEYW